MTIEQGELGSISESSDGLSQEHELNFFKFFESIAEHTEIWDEDSLLPRRLYVYFMGWGSEEFGTFTLFDVYQKVTQQEAGSWDWTELRNFILTEEGFEGDFKGT